MHQKQKCLQYSYLRKSNAHTWGGGRSFSVTRGQQGVILVEDILDGSELYRKMNSESRWLPHDNRAQDA